MEKKLGIFQFPKVKGAKIQDLDVGAVAYPLTIFFEGPDNDIEAEKFFIACSEKGLWNINHPVKAFMSTRVITIAPGKNPAHAAQLMVKHDVGRLPVVDNGKLVGIIKTTKTICSLLVVVKMGNKHTALSR